MITAAEAREKVILSWSEKDLQTHVVGLARGLGWMSYHTFDSRRSDRGYPDLHLIHPITGASLFRELKSTKGRLSPAQVDWSAALRTAGHDFAVWRPADVVSGAIVMQLQEGARR